jgi:hypothetical protein
MIDEGMARLSSTFSAQGKLQPKAEDFGREWLTWVT